MLKQLTRTIESPSSLYEGLRSEKLCLTENLLVFARHERSELQLTKGQLHHHHRFVLVCCLETAGVIGLDLGQYAIRPGEVMLIFPFQFHHFFDLEAASLNWLFFTFESGSPAALQSLRNRPCPMSPEQTARMEEALRVWLDQEQPARARSNTCILTLSLLLQELANTAPQHPRQASSRQNPESSQLLNAINEQVIANPSIRIEELAGLFHQSESHLRRRFRELCGGSLGKYLSQHRIAQAAYLVQNSRQSLSEIALDLGYESLAAFSRAFKSAFGRAPSAYRKQTR